MALLGTLLNYQIARKNLGFQQQNLQYQKDLQQQIFAREDSAIQRRVRDLESAGVSRNLAAGSAAPSGAAINTRAPQQAQLGNMKGLSEVAINAISILQGLKNVDKTVAETNLINANSAKANTELQFTVATLQSRIDLKKYETELARARTVMGSIDSRYYAEADRFLQVMKKGDITGDGFKLSPVIQKELRYNPKTYEMLRGWLAYRAAQHNLDIAELMGTTTTGASAKVPNTLALIMNFLSGNSKLGNVLRDGLINMLGESSDF